MNKLALSDFFVDSHAHLVTEARAAANRAAGGPKAVDVATSLADLLAARPWPFPVLIVESDRPRTGENERLLDCAADAEVAGVIGRLDLLSADPVAAFEALLLHPQAAKLRGFRLSLLPVHGEQWNAPLRDLTVALGETGRTLELLAAGETLSSVSSIAEQAACSIVLDHLGLPPWAESEQQWQRWREQMIHVAESTSTFCKWSALPELSAPEDAQKRAEEATDLAFEHFGPKRLMYGSNMPWPPGLTDTADAYPVARALSQASQLAQEEAQDLVGGTCRRAYGLA